VNDSPAQAPTAAVAQAIPVPQQVPALYVKDLFHTFGRHVALAGVSFSVAPGSIHGFVGPNGAGKTTAIKIVATLLKPQRGEVRVFDHDVVRHRRVVRRTMGLMPDHFSMYPKMTVFEYLDFFAAAYGLDLKRRNRVCADILNLTDMTGRRDQLIKGLSRGMQQRVNLCRVLVNDPSLLLLDEPASGLDPRARIELMEILQALRGMGKTIFISSHILSELATLCDSVTIIDRGQVKYTGSIDQLLTHGDGAVGFDVVLDEDLDDAEDRFANIPGVRSVEKNEAECDYLIWFDSAQVDSNVVLRSLLDSGAALKSFRPAQRHLNEAFMALTEPGVAPSENDALGGGQ
jgi:ABC-2 type transport system ATP-binding protein